jgi:molybdopterin molybdotransferase
MNETAANELDVHGAFAALRDELVPIAQQENVTLADAAGRILARDLLAPLDLPAFANAAMDGYAVRAVDCTGAASLRVIGTAFAGHGYAGPVGPGSAVRIMTGAPIPSGADAVVIQEEAQRDGERVSFSTPVRPGLNVRPRGEHLRIGDVLIAAGSSLRAAEIGLAAAVGETELAVFRRLHVGVASTGDELADPPAPLTDAGSYDANRPMMAIACRAAGFDVIDLGICKDRAPDFAQLVERAERQGVDALLISGGSAMGEADVVRKVEAVQFLAINIRPGRGITFADWHGRSRRFALLGLPGNAVAAFVMLHLVGMPALQHLAGANARVPAHMPIPLAEDLQCKAGRVDYRRGRLEHNAAGELTVRPLAQQGSAMLRTLVDADVLIAAGPKAHYPAGSPVLVVPLASLPR